jgi:hypothetical protein
VISQYTPDRAAFEILKGCEQILKAQVATLFGV